MAAEAKKWMALDNAAKIYPAAMRKNWMAMFRLSAELTDAVDAALLQDALRRVMPRFPGFAVHLHRGAFWFYLEQTDDCPTVQPDVKNPCVRMDPAENKRFLFRVRTYDRRIAVEYFHAVTDGTGGLTFLKTLVAEYLTLRYGASIPRGGGILDCGEPCDPEELEDSFLRYAGTQTHSRAEADAYYIDGTEEPSNIIHIVTGLMSASQVLEKAREKGVTLTEYLAGVLILAIDAVQRREQKHPGRLQPVKVCLPVNLRSFFPSRTLRNFSLYINPGIEPRLGLFTLDEVLTQVHSTMAMNATTKNLQARFAMNVQTEKSRVLRVTPLFLKNLVMRAVFVRMGDRKTSTTLTNLGRVSLPPEMSRYVSRMDIILGPLYRNHVMAASLSYGDTLVFNFTRTIAESAVEREFFRRLVTLGIHVKVESNDS